MTLLYILGAAVVAFGFGFLLGEHRAVREANTILDANNRLLLQTIGDSVRAPTETRVADEPAFPARLH